MKERLKQLCKGIKLRVVLMYLVLPILINIIIESLSRLEFLGGIKYMLDSPVLFCFNTLIIMLTLSVALFFKRQWFMVSIVSLIWLAFGLTDFIVLHFRRTPFSAVDFLLIKHAIRVSGHYFNVGTIIIFGVCVVAAIAGLVFLWLKAPKIKIDNWKSYVVAALYVAGLSFLIVFMTKNSDSVAALTTNYSNISEAYENYGFAYCFANSLLDSGISQPSDYSEESVKAITDRLQDVPDSEERPNVIIVQLESFFDPKYVNNLEYSTDPCPNFTKLKEEYSHGFLTVQSIGAGTANTEFEILTGMNLDHFGTSEYPYKTILKKTTIESICTNLRALGYTSHAVHNNDATFYGRQRVFSRIGFDSFTSIEYMNNLEFNENDWAKDHVLVEEIKRTLESTEGPDFTYGITVQSHGSYDVASDEPYPVTVTSLYQKQLQEQGEAPAPETAEDTSRQKEADSETEDTEGSDEDEEEELTEAQKADESFLNSMEYYCKELGSVDTFIADLIDMVEERDEKTVIVFYGDHLPTLSLENSDLDKMNLYQTEYIIWDNLGMEKQVKDMRSSDLSAYVMEKLDFHQGHITKMHQQLKPVMDFEEFDSLLETMEYDMLYGKFYMFDGVKPYERTTLQMGAYPITITDVQYKDGVLDIYGSDFTTYSVVCCDGERLETEFINPTHLRVKDYAFDEDKMQDVMEKVKNRKILEQKQKEEMRKAEEAAKAAKKAAKKSKKKPKPTPSPSPSPEPTQTPIPSPTAEGETPEPTAKVEKEEVVGFEFTVQQIDASDKKVGETESYVWLPEAEESLETKK